MVAANRLMASGMQSLNANHLGVNASPVSIVGAGASAGNATLVSAPFTYVTSASANTGVILKNAGGQPTTAIYNGSLVTLKVYPATGEKINNGTASTGALSVPTLKSVILVGTENAWVGMVSA